MSSCTLTRRHLLMGAAVQTAVAWQTPTVQRVALVPLRPGASVPQGWLHNWSRTAAAGITGHLDEYSATYSEAWKGHGFEARGANPDGTGWPLEQSSYWLDGAVRLAYILRDEALIAKVRARLDMVVNGVLGGGESFIYWRPLSVLDNAFNNWAHSHMGRALVAYYRASGRKEVLDALVKVYRQYPLPPLQPAFGNVGGAVNADPALDTYTMTGDRAILDRVLALRRDPSYPELVKDWSSHRLRTGHNVIFYEHSRVPALLSAWSGDTSDLEATLGALEWNDGEALLPMGVSSGEEWQAGIGATRNTETCNVAAAMWTWLWLARITGEARYADRIERIFFNAAPAPIARDFKTMCYYQSANRYSTKLPDEVPVAPGDRDSYKFTEIGCNVLCCVGNVNRLIPNYVMHMWMSTPDGGVAALLYGPSQVSVKVAGRVPVVITNRTAYPFDESMRLNIQPAAAVEFPLYLRIPAWCAAPALRVNGRKIETAVDAKGFVKVVRRWKKGDGVELTLPMTVRVDKGRETPFPRVPYFTKSRQISHLADIHSPYASISRGPLLYALPIADETPNQEKPGQQFNFALDGTQIQADRTAMPEHWAWPLDAPVRLAAPAVQFDWKPTDLQPLPEKPVEGGRPARIALIPYGCTKFRVSMLPVTRRVWEA
jgi:hypothetical protein